MIPTYKWEFWPIGDGGCLNLWGSRVKGRLELLYKYQPSMFVGSPVKWLLQNIEVVLLKTKKIMGQVFSVSNSKQR
jgi:hypothetical protein